VPVAAGGKLHRQRRKPGEELRTHIRRRRASPRQRRHATRQVRRRVRFAFIDLRRDGHAPLQVVAKGEYAGGYIPGIEGIAAKGGRFDADIFTGDDWSGGVARSNAGSRANDDRGRCETALTRDWS